MNRFLYVCVVIAGYNRVAVLMVGYTYLHTRDVKSPYLGQVVQPGAASEYKRAGFQSRIVQSVRR